MTVSTTLQLRCESSDLWLKAVLDNFDDFLLDHAANEKKAASVALNLAAHYPDKPELVAAAIDLAIEELCHYREVFGLIRERQLTLPADKKDTYVNQLRSAVRNGREDYFLDRLLVAAVVEARGLERFAKIAAALPAGSLQSFYQTIARSEARHAELFLSLAQRYFETERISTRLQTLLDLEAQIVVLLPVRAALH